MSVKRLTIAYKCPCMAFARDLEVDARHESESVTTWLDTVVRPVVTQDHHARRGRQCVNQSFELRLPFDGSNIVGQN